MIKYKMKMYCEFISKSLKKEFSVIRLAVICLFIIIVVVIIIIF